MVNVSKIKSLAKLKGITIAFICSSVGMQRGYLNDVAAGKTNMPEDRIRTIADILDTSYEYLTDQTDDPIGPEAKQSLEMFDLLADPANPIANRFSPNEMRDIVINFPLTLPKKRTGTGRAYLKMRMLKQKKTRH